MSWRRNRSPMTMMSSQNHRTNMNTAKASTRKLRKVKPSEKKSICGFSLIYWTDLLRASRAACAFFVACEMLPILAGGTCVRRRLLGSVRMPSLAVSPVGGRGGNCAARRMARARRAASMCALRTSSFCIRSISLFTRFNAAANTCLRWRGCSAVPGKLAPLPQTLAQRLEVIKRGVIDFGMVTAQNHLVLVVAENAALEFARYGHGG